MALKPVSPHSRPKKKAQRPAPVPIVIVQKKKSGGGGFIMLLLLLAAAGGGYFVYNNQMKNEAALAAQHERQEANAKAMAENERLREERDDAKAEQKKAASQPKKTKERKVTAMGTTSGPLDYSHEQEDGDDGYSYDESAYDYEEKGTSTALGSTVKPKAGTGIYAVTDNSAPAFDLAATGLAERKATNALNAAIKKASKDNTYHDLLADLTSSLTAVDPGLISDDALPALPDNDNKLQRVAQSLYVALKLASVIENEGNVNPSKHASFQAWLLKDKAKAARAFAQALDSNGVNDAAAAAGMMSKLRETWLSSPSKAMGSIKKITKN